MFKWMKLKDSKPRIVELKYVPTPNRKIFCELYDNMQNGRKLDAFKFWEFAFNVCNVEPGKHEEWLVGTNSNAGKEAFVWAPFIVRVVRDE